METLVKIQFGAFFVVVSFKEKRVSKVLKGARRTGRKEKRIK